MQRQPELNQLFHFAFINYILRTLGEATMKDVDSVTTTAGFETLLCAVAQSKECHKHFKRMMQAAVQEAWLNGANLNQTREAIMSHLKPGARVEPR